ncbi:hypothetical protein BGP_1878 [Beggiatoa sp. PS]|nr:hypothetical protein BGP_1878 [Beggiatoa sp. PS]
MNYSKNRFLNVLHYYHDCAWYRHSLYATQTLNIIETLFHRQSLIVQGLLVDIAIVAIEAFGMEGVAPFGSRNKYTGGVVA